MCAEDPNLVSIIMPAYNCEDTIENSIISALHQTFTHFELIIIDDQSIDKTAEVIRRFAEQDKRIKFLKTVQNGGPAKARNIGISAARGRYLAFLDSDDAWLPRKLEIQLGAMQKNNAVFCFSSYVIFRHGSLYGTVYRAPETTSFELMLSGSVVGCLTVVYDRVMLGDHLFSNGAEYLEGSFWSKFINYIGHEDYSTWLKIFQKIDSKSSKLIVGVSEPLALYRLREGSFSASKIRSAIFQFLIYRLIFKLSLARSLYHMVCYFYNALVKRAVRFVRRSDLEYRFAERI